MHVRLINETPRMNPAIHRNAAGSVAAGFPARSHVIQGKVSAYRAICLPTRIAYPGRQRRPRTPFLARMIEESEISGPSLALPHEHDRAGRRERIIKAEWPDVHGV